MLTLYLIALAIGGTLILVSLVFGGHGADADADADLGHADFETETEVDGDVGHDVGHGLDLGAIDLWIPFASLRFWIFFSAFFGLMGTLLTSFESMSTQLAIGGVSIATGYLAGVAASGAVRWLMRHETDSAVRSSDMIGVRARVLLPVGKDRTGKVRLSLKDQVIDARATTDDDTEYPIGATVMVYDSRSDGELLVTRAED